MIADRVGIINVIVVVTWAWCIVAFCWLGVSKIAGYYVFTVFYGITSGSFQSINPTAVTRITKRLDMVGTRLGSMLSPSAICPTQPLFAPLNQTLGTPISSCAPHGLNGANVHVVAFSITSFASLTGPPLGGALQVATGGQFTAPQAWAASATAVGTILFTAARIIKAGYDPKVKC